MKFLPFEIFTYREIIQKVFSNFTDFQYIKKKDNRMGWKNQLFIHLNPNIIPHCIVEQDEIGEIADLCTANVPKEHIIAQIEASHNQFLRNWRSEEYKKVSLIKWYWTSFNCALHIYYISVEKLPNVRQHWQPDDMPKK